MTTNWREYPKLQSRLHPDFPDDVQVIVHDGGPRLTDHHPELVWVRIMGVEGSVFAGEMLNAPEQLATVNQGSRIAFVVPESGQHPLMVRQKYLEERDRWVVHPCDRCGLSELFDAPSDLIAKVFPNQAAGEVPEMFTAFCGMC